jgi:predicted phosphohydrolase
MKLFALGDPHLSFDKEGNEYKPMGIFGDGWQNHGEKIRTHWCSVVGEEDVVLMPGDISWAMKMEEALSDFQFLESLPGTKLIGKGNHDFWWSTASKMNTFFEENHIHSVHILNNNAYLVENQVICGTRGWFLEEKQQVTVGSVDYEKIVNREVIRLKLSLDSAVKLQKEYEEKNGVMPPISVFLHFPPVWLDFICRPFVDTLHEYGDPPCYFGHIHGVYNAPKNTVFEGISLNLISSDAMDFTLYRLPKAEM